MADAVNAIIRNPAMYKKPSRIGREEVNNIRWEDAGEKVIKIYNSLLGK
jgi:glycosyltransferase involved in cell wall biosynthesis